MARKAFELMMEGLGDALAYVEGDRSRGRIANVDVKAVRAATRMSQQVFADTFHLKVTTVRDWEQGRRVPDTGSVTLLKMIRADPQGVREIIQKAVN